MLNTSDVELPADLAASPFTLRLILDATGDLTSMVLLLDNAVVTITLNGSAIVYSGTTRNGSSSITSVVGSGGRRLLQSGLGPWDGQHGRTLLSQNPIVCKISQFAVNAAVNSAISKVLCSEITTTPLFSCVGLLIPGLGELDIPVCLEAIAQYLVCKTLTDLAHRLLLGNQPIQGLPGCVNPFSVSLPRITVALLADTVCACCAAADCRQQAHAKSIASAPQ